MNSPAAATAPVTLDYVTALIREAAKSRLEAGVELDEGTRIEDVDLSSLQLAGVFFRIEEERGVRFDGGELSELSTLGELVRLANRRRSRG